MSSLTFTIIKPNAVSKGATGKILDILISHGFRIRAMKMLCMSLNDAEHFYLQHKGKPFFGRLVKFMTSGAIVVAVLEHDRDDAITTLRSVVGATDPSKAEMGTLRQMFGDSLTRNAIHASDSQENASQEWAHFFTQDDIVICDYVVDLSLDE